jgi:hypothetical protein
VTATGCAMLVTAYALAQVLQDQLYVPELDYPDATTLIMICGLIVSGLIALRRCSDMQAVAIAWVVAVSCLIAYEAVYKWSFYLLPFGRDMPPPELRAFILQLSVAATVLTGFADKHLRVTIRSCLWLTVFCALWTLWLLIGFPQLDGRVVHPQTLRWHADRQLVYLINRSSKLALFITYYTFLPPIRGVRHHDSATAENGIGSP